MLKKYQNLLENMYYSYRYMHLGRKTTAVLAVVRRWAPLTGVVKTYHYR